MALETWLAFLVACWLISMSPGAGAISCMAAGLRYGFRRAVWNIAGLILGILETAAGVYVSTATKDIVSYGLLIACVLLLPQGLFGKAEARKV